MNFSFQCICLAAFFLLLIEHSQGQIRFPSSGGQRRPQRPRPRPPQQSPRPVPPKTQAKSEPSGCNCLPQSNCPDGLGQLRTQCVAENGGQGICCIPQKDVVLTRVGFVQSDFKPKSITPNVVRTGFQMGEATFNNIQEQERKRLKKKEFLDKGDPARGHAFFFQRTPSARRINDLAYTIAEASREIANLESLNPQQSFFGLSQLRIGPQQMGFSCPLNEATRCNSNDKFRTIDGTCNNLQRPLFGKSETGFGRIESALYDDGIMSPRETSVDGEPLPNVRHASNTILLDVDIPDSEFTLSVMQWAQFVDHDLTHAPFDDMDGEAISCCENGRLVSPMPVPCFPILIHANDGFYGPRRQSCINFVRSMLALNENCALGPVEQLNALTHWLDGSMIYGSTDEEAEAVSEFSTGFMKTSNNNLPPVNRSIDCEARDRQSACFVGGDSRISEQPALTVMHTLWVREHNRIASELRRINPHWSGRKLFEETRRIVVAQVQHITYKEWLPIIIGPSLMSRLGINVLQNGYRQSYNPSLNPAQFNEFATAAFRFGHSMVQGLFRLFSSTGRQSTERLRDVFNAPHLLQRNPGLVESFINSLTVQKIQTLDNFVTQELSNHLFQTPRFDFGMDLMSLNLQRGRDHAISTYNQMRQRFNVGRARNFADLLSTTPPELVKRIQTVYRNVDDIDLFIGGMTEKPLPDAVLGPTFANIVGLQFQLLQNADRFFYDMAGQAGSFTPAQLQEIRKSSMARIYCDNSEVPEMQPQAFVAVNRNNPRVPCSSNVIPSMNLNVFKE